MVSSQSENGSAARETGNPKLRTYYAIIGSQSLSLIGSRISGLAVSIWLYGTTGDVTPLALVGFFFVVPQIIAAGFAGALADRFDRKLVMIVSDVRAVASLRHRAHASRLRDVLRAGFYRLGHHAGSRRGTRSRERYPTNGVAACRHHRNGLSRDAVRGGWRRRLHPHRP
jgi:hypothetical protein